MFKLCQNFILLISSLLLKVSLSVQITVFHYIIFVGVFDGFMLKFCKNKSERQPLYKASKSMMLWNQRDNTRDRKLAFQIVDPSNMYASRLQGLIPEYSVRRHEHSQIGPHPNKQKYYVIIKIQLYSGNSCVVKYSNSTLETKDNFQLPCLLFY